MKPFDTFPAAVSYLNQHGMTENLDCYNIVFGRSYFKKMSGKDVMRDYSAIITYIGNNEWVVTQFESEVMV